MLSASPLGRLERVDLREVWKNEAGSFTPWLAQPENIALLGEAIDIELEVEAQEKYVGPFRADILCKDTLSEAWVLIENQLEKTDHSHLGQLLTYAAGLDAVTIVWIAQRFTEEHRATLDWLNRITDEQFRFFGLEVELWRIGDSACAPKFNVVSQPNEWTRSVRTGTQGIEEGSLSDIRQTQLAYWTVLRDILSKRAPQIRWGTAKPRHVLPAPVGKSGFRLVILANYRDQRIGVILNCNRPDNKASFHWLRDRREAIEAEIGSQLEWEELPGQRRSLIQLRRPDDPANREQWPQQHEWLCERAIAFHRAFSRQLQALSTEHLESGDETDAESLEV